MNRKAEAKLAITALLDQLTAGLIDTDQVESMKETPDRWVRMLTELSSGYEQDPEEILSRTFNQTTSNSMIVVKDIDFTSTCEHHLLPFIGKAHVAYIPSGPVVGLSKIPRLVDCFARRFQLQERMTEQIADSMVEHLKPQGVGVIISAQHQCMSCRGVRKTNAMMVTSALRGEFLTDPSVRAEFLRLA